MESIKRIFSDYKLYMLTFTGLVILTLAAVWLTQVRFAEVIVVSLIMIIAVVQAAIVLFYNMHLKFHEKILLVFTLSAFSLIIALIGVTLFDYLFR